MLKIYWRMWQVNWAETWQYRANLLMYLVYWLVSPIIYMSVWMTVAQSGPVGGKRAEDFAAYYLVALVVNIITAQISAHILGNKILDGTLAAWLVLPAHPVMTHTLVGNLAFKALHIVAMIPIMLLLGWLFAPGFSLSMGNILLAVPALVIGFALNFLFGALMTFIGFWTTRMHAIHNAYFAAYMFFAGEFVPLDLLPPAMQSVARVLPFHLSLSYPVRLILGQVDAAELAFASLMQALWLPILGALFVWMWRAGLRRYAAVGG